MQCTGDRLLFFNLKLIYFFIYRWKKFIPWIFKYVFIFFAAMITNMCLIFFMFITYKHMSRVFMHRRKIYLWWIMSDREFSIWFLLCFIYVYRRLFSFCFVEMKMGGGVVPTLWFTLKILNMVFWIEDLSSLVLGLLCWMHISIQHDWFYLDVARKG